MSNAIAKKIVFSRQRKVNEFMSRVHGMADKGADCEQLVRYTSGVCLSNKSIEKAFLKKLAAVYPRLTTLTQQQLDTHRANKNFRRK
ncbi:hypothetical protein [Alteromonas gracilis]|uniref:hypothetical protein n=1 Tax=Alteromonas gracilis TaxID=1479524 RepID=UPI00373710EF